MSPFAAIKQHIYNQISALQRGGGEKSNAAVDVVESKHFSLPLRQVNCTVGPDGRSSAKTSNGQAQVVLEG